MSAAELPAGARCHRIPVPGGTLHVDEWGPPGGRPLVLLHHGGDGFAHSPWPEPFPELAAGGWRLLRLDRLGYGLSSARPRGFPPGFFASDLEQLHAVLDQLAPQGRLVLAGTSDGGSLALLAAARRPERVAAVAVDGAHSHTEPATMVPVLLDMRRRFEEKHGPATPGEEIRLATVRAWFTGWLHICELGWDIRPDLAAVRCPVSVLQGELDGIVPDAHAFGLAAALGGPATVEILPGGAHLSQKSHPAEWAHWLRRFLRSLPALDRP